MGWGDAGVSCFHPCLLQSILNKVAKSDPVTRVKSIHCSGFQKLPFSLSIQSQSPDNDPQGSIQAGAHLSAFFSYYFLSPCLYHTSLLTAPSTSPGETWQLLLLLTMSSLTTFIFLFEISTQIPHFTHYKIPSHIYKFYVSEIRMSNGINLNWQHDI